MKNGDKKFRIYDLNRKEWLHDTEHAVHLFGETIMFGELYTRPDDTIVPLSEQNDLVAQEWTGLKDEYGKDVFIGDILQNETTHPMEIIWMETGYGFRYEDLGITVEENIVSEADCEIKNGIFIYLKIVGNIFDGTAPAPRKGTE